MSTAIVSAEHINVILEAATRDADEEGFEWFAQGKWWTFTRENRDRIGQLMLDANLDAYGRRYLDATEIYVYSYSIPKRIYEPIEVLKAIDGYEYQCSVDASWDTHPIHLMMQQLRKRVIAWLDGYDAAEWLIYPRAPSAHPGEVSCHAAGHRSGQVDANVHALSYPHGTCSSSSKEAKNEHPQ